MTLEQLSTLNSRLKETNYRVEMHPYSGKLALYQGTNKKPIIAGGSWAVDRRITQLLRRTNAISRH